MSNKRNLLLNKLQRHNQVSTLFRSPDDTQPEGNIPGDSALVENRTKYDVRPGTTKAGLLPPDSQLPHGYMVNGPLPPALQSPEVLQATPTSESLPAEREISEQVGDRIKQQNETLQPTLKNPLARPVDQPAPAARTSKIVQRQVEAMPLPVSLPQNKSLPVNLSLQKLPQSQIAQSESDPSKEESKFTQKELDRLQAIFDLHSQPSQEMTVPSAENQTDNLQSSPASTIKESVNTPLAKPNNIQRTMDAEAASSGLPETPGTSPNASANINNTISEPAKSQGQTPVTMPDQAESLALPGKPTSNQQLPENAHSVHPGPSIIPTPDKSPSVESPIKNQASENPNQSLFSSVPNMPKSAVPTSTVPSSAASNQQNVIAENQVPLQSNNPIQRTVDASAASRNTTKSSNLPTVESDQTQRLDEETLQSQPLESVWNVERRPNIQSVSPRLPAAPIQLETPPVPANIQRVLSETAPGQPTDSHVETIAPRMPRPVLPPRIPERESIQRAPDETTPTLSSDKKEIINSAVGPLPADLWRLIGEQPPVKNSGTKPASEKKSYPGERNETTEISNRSFEYQAAVPPSPMPSNNKSAIPSASGNQLIQRSPEEGSAENGAGSSSNQVSAPEAEKKTAQPADLDMEDLSTKVYAEVKRRLSIEWERLRNRF